MKTDFDVVDCITNEDRSSGHKNDIAQPKTDKCLSSPSHFSSVFCFCCCCCCFNRLTVVEVLFCSLIKGITPHPTPPFA